MGQNDPQIYCTWEWNALISSKRPTIWYKTSADVSLYSSCCQNGHEVDKLFFIIFLTTFINFKICSKNIFFQWFLLSNKMMKDIWHTGTILRAYGVISSDFVPFLLHIWKVNKIENGDIFHFFCQEMVLMAKHREAEKSLWLFATILTNFLILTSKKTYSLQKYKEK